MCERCHGYDPGDLQQTEHTIIEQSQHFVEPNARTYQVLVFFSVEGNTIRILAHSPISVYVGHSTTLPCWLSPPRSIETLDIHWYHRDHPEAPILIYQHNESSPAAENQFFQGRVSFGTRDAESARLTSGDVSLRLLNVTLRDAGEYTCHVNDDQDYDVGSVILTVLSEYHVKLY